MTCRYFFTPTKSRKWSNYLECWYIYRSTIPLALRTCWIFLEPTRWEAIFGDLIAADLSMSSLADQHFKATIIITTTAGINLHSLIAIRGNFDPVSSSSLLDQYYLCTNMSCQLFTVSWVTPVWDILHSFRLACIARDLYIVADRQQTHLFWWVVSWCIASSEVSHSYFLTISTKKIICCYFD